jgi:hypothetical protein
LDGELMLLLLGGTMAGQGKLLLLLLLLGCTMAVQAAAAGWYHGSTCCFCWAVSWQYRLLLLGGTMAVQAAAAAAGRYRGSMVSLVWCLLAVGALQRHSCAFGMAGYALLQKGNIDCGEAHAYK